MLGTRLEHEKMPLLENAGFELAAQTRSSESNKTHSDLMFSASVVKSLLGYLLVFIQKGSLVD